MTNTLKKPELHKSVLPNEVLEVLDVRKNAPLKGKRKIIDATLGLGGHTELLVKNGFDVLGIDTDREMLALAENRLKEACPTLENNKTSRGSFKLVFGNFANIDKIAFDNGFNEVDAVLYDLGVSSPQIISPDRGFSFQNDLARLDMRLDLEGNEICGSDILNVLREDQLIEVFEAALPNYQARRLVTGIVRERAKKRIEKVGDFNNIIEKTIKSNKKINSSTLPFLALRMAVNSELAVIAESLPKAISLLKHGGRMVVISFHSGEDSLVKNLFKSFSANKSGDILTKKPILPSSEEITNNPRARSAKMRVFLKTI
jgi:16S rRNA (cytosine1402-N4)-methyltransferase